MAERPNAFDPRLTPARDDLAASFLKGLVPAARYGAGTQHQVIADMLAIRKTPDDVAGQETQMLFGELFTVYDLKDGWAWGQAGFDDYVGYAALAGLSAQITAATHRVSALRTYRFSAPDLKSAPIGMLSKNAKLTEVAQSGDYFQEAQGGWVWRGHTCQINTPTSLQNKRKNDPVTVAQDYLGAPYFWGGRSSLGLDCSALMQNAYEAIGKAIPRDADLQEDFFSTAEHGAILWQDGGSAGPWQALSLQRGDLIFWPGHTGIMVDADQMLHANATHMSVTINDLRAISTGWAAVKNLKVRQIIRPA